MTRTPRPARAVQRRPLSVTAVVVLLSGIWAVNGTIMLAITYYRLVDRLRASPIGPMPGTSPYKETAIEVSFSFFLLLVTLPLLIWAATRAFRGGQEGRIGLWITSALLALEPLRYALWEIMRGPDKTAAYLILMPPVFAAALAALLLALPTTSSFFRESGTDAPETGLTW